MLVSGSKYEAFHISGQIMRRGNTLSLIKSQSSFLCCKTFTFLEEQHEIQKNDTYTGGIENIYLVAYLLRR